MTSDNTFTLDPDYENFNPKVTTLKFETVAGMHFSRIVVYFTVATCIALILLIGFIVTEYHDQLFLKNGVETSFTFANCTEQRKMINTRGQSATIYTATLELSYLVDTTSYNTKISSSGRCNYSFMDLRGIYLRDDPHQFFLTTIKQLEEPFYIRQDNFAIGFVTAIVATGSSAYWTIKTVKTRKNLRIFSEVGQLLDGKIVPTEDTWIGIIGSKYFIEVNYVFFVRDKKHVVKGRTMYPRRDFRLSPIRFTLPFFKSKYTQSEMLRYEPPIGATIKVMYVDDKTFVML